MYLPLFPLQQCPLRLHRLLYRRVFHEFANLCSD
jgi:hypothetical protein